MLCLRHLPSGLSGQLEQSSATAQVMNKAHLVGWIPQERRTKPRMATDNLLLQHTRTV